MSTYQFTPLQEAWLQALESGEYKQGQASLHNISHDEYCCLGVACEVFIKRGGDLVKDTSERYLYTRYNEESMYLPQVLIDALKLHDRSGLIDDPMRIHTDLADMNDMGKTHQEIAAYIRANPEKVFKQ